MPATPSNALPALKKTSHECDWRQAFFAALTSGASAPRAAAIADAAVELLDARRERARPS